MERPPQRTQREVHCRCVAGARMGSGGLRGRTGPSGGICWALWGSAGAMGPCWDCTCGRKEGRSRGALRAPCRPGKVSPNAWGTLGRERPGRTWGHPAGGRQLPTPLHGLLAPPVSSHDIDLHVVRTTDAWLPEPQPAMLCGSSRPECPSSPRPAPWWDPSGCTWDCVNPSCTRG